MDKQYIKFHTYGEKKKKSRSICKVVQHMNSYTYLLQGTRARQMKTRVHGQLSMRRAETITCPDNRKCLSEAEVTNQSRGCRKSGGNYQIISPRMSFREGHNHEMEDSCVSARGEMSYLIYL